MSPCRRLKVEVLVEAEALVLGLVLVLVLVEVGVDCQHQGAVTVAALPSQAPLLVGRRPLPPSQNNRNRTTAGWACGRT